MEVMGRTKDMNRDEMIRFVLDCRHPSGGFGGNVDHDPHLLYTLSAIQVPPRFLPHSRASTRFVSHSRASTPPLTLLLQILVILDALDTIDKEATVNFVASLQQPDGSVAGDEWGEIDTRFTYCALNCLALLDRYVSRVPPCVALKSTSTSRPAACTELTRTDVCVSFFRVKLPTAASVAFRVQRAMRYRAAPPPM